MRVRMVFVHAPYIQKVPRVPHFSAFHSSSGKVNMNGQWLSLAIIFLINLKITQCSVTTCTCTCTYTVHVQNTGKGVYVHVHVYVHCTSHMLSF